MDAAIYKVLSDAFSKEIPAPSYERKSSKLLISAATTSTLFNKFPMVLDPSQYANPLSTSNPNGDLISLWRFRQLTDPLPQAGTDYYPSSSSLEMNYSQIIKGAIVEDEDSFASIILGEARKALATQTFANMDGNPGNWHPVYAVPDNWYGMKSRTAVKKVSITLPEGLSTDMARNSNSGKNNEITSKLKILDANNAVSDITFDAKSKVNAIDIEYQMVAFSRPWFNPMIFETGGWYLKGQKAGFCSSGNNDGVGALAMVPTSMIIATDVKAQAQWTEKDQQLLNRIKDSKQQLSLGPLLIDAGQDQKQLHVIGWIVSHIPFSPQASLMLK